MYRQVDDNIRLRLYRREAADTTGDDGGNGSNLAAGNNLLERPDDGIVVFNVPYREDNIFLFGKTNKFICFLDCACNGFSSRRWMPRFMTSVATS
jgi:hypothetical protein